jgi:DNA-nicking Smr family endonuclease
VSYSGEPKEKRRHRRLSREELELWHQVTRSVARLSRAPAAARQDREPPARFEIAEPAGARPEPSHPRAPTRPALPGYTPPQMQSPAQPALAPLDRRLRKKLARGRSSVDDVIDLHGLRQDEAHRALRGFLAAAQRRDAKVVLIVTGKGSGSAALGSWPERTGGVLYRAVPQWLSSPEFRRIVVGFEEADAGHGGAGALYVRLRRADRPAK